jgi:predicted metal-binding protein
MPPATARIDVCVTCLAGQPASEDEARPGEKLYAALVAEAARDPAAASSIQLHKTACLASCARGCALVISQPGKWSYLLGSLSPELAVDLVSYAKSYRDSKTGVVMPSKRPASLSDVVLARVPSFTPPDQT